MLLRILTLTLLGFLCFSASAQNNSNQAQYKGLNVEGVARKAVDQKLVMMAMEQNLENRYGLLLQLKTEIESHMAKIKKKPVDEALSWSLYHTAFEPLWLAGSAEAIKKDRRELKHKIEFDWGAGSGFDGHWPPHALAAMKALSFISGDAAMAKPTESTTSQ